MKTQPDEWSSLSIEIGGLGVAEILSDEELEIHISEWEEAYNRLKISKEEGPLPILYAEKERRQNGPINQP